MKMQKCIGVFLVITSLLLTSCLVVGPRGGVRPAYFNQSRVAYSYRETNWGNHSSSTVKVKGVVRSY